MPFRLDFPLRILSELKGKAEVRVGICTTKPIEWGIVSCGLRNMTDLYLEAELAGLSLLAAKGEEGEVLLMRHVCTEPFPEAELAVVIQLKAKDDWVDTSKTDYLWRTY